MATRLSEFQGLNGFIIGFNLAMLDLFQRVLYTIICTTCVYTLRALMILVFFEDADTIDLLFPLILACLIIRVDVPIRVLS